MVNVGAQGAAQPVDNHQGQPKKFHFLAANPGKRRAEILWCIWWLVTLPVQIVTMLTLDLNEKNDIKLTAMALFGAAGAIILPLAFRVPEDRGKPLRELYAFRMIVFLAIIAMLGGFIGTDPFYEVLGVHYALNTDWNPNGVPFFMLPATIGVFSFYSVVLGTLYRIIAQLLDRSSTKLGQDSMARHIVICALLCGVIPIAETFGYASMSEGMQCFDSGVGMWGLNILIYGPWYFSMMFFYTRWDTQPGERQRLDKTVLSGFAALGIFMVCMAIVKTFIAPHFTEVHHGVRNLNDWSVENCLGPKPTN